MARLLCPGKDIPHEHDRLAAPLALERVEKRDQALGVIAALSEDQMPATRRRGRRPRTAAAAPAVASAKPKRTRRAFSEETKAKMREAQQRRRAKEKGEPVNK